MDTHTEKFKVRLGLFIVGGVGFVCTYHIHYRKTTKLMLTLFLSLLQLFIM